MTDSSVGKATLIKNINNNYQIDSSLGQLSEKNLFHSFDKFSINKNETATFTGGNLVENIIGRVTGDSISTINGKISATMPQANLYLINPNGIVFGNEAQIDIQGSFYGLTSDYIELKDGNKYYSNIANDSVLSSAPPAAFGFLSENPANITMKSKNISIKNDKNFGLIGGNIDISIDENRAGINAGNISLTSMKNKGKVLFSENELIVSEDQKLGTITLHDAAKLRVDTTGVANAGNISIQANQLNILDNSKINSDSRGTGNAGHIIVEADVIKMTGNSEITSESYSDGHAGSITLITNNLEMQDSALIDSTTYDGAGNAGDITIQTKALSMINDATIGTFAHQNTTGNAGNITVDATDINMIGKSNGSANSVLISSNTLANSTGKGGEIEIRTDNLNLHNNATVAVSSKGKGDAGNIDIIVNSELSAKNGHVLSQAEIADGGNIMIAAGNRIDLQVSQLSTEAIGEGGNINFDTSLFILDRSKINASSTNSTGGNIDLKIDTYIRSKDVGSSIKATGVIDGIIAISSPETDIGKSLKNTDINLLTNNVKDPCSIQLANDESYFSINNRECEE